MKHYFYLHWQDARLALLKMLRQPVGSLLNLLMLGMAYACVGTVLAQAVGLGYLWTHGMLAKPAAGSV